MAKPNSVTCDNLLKHQLFSSYPSLPSSLSLTQSSVLHKRPLEERLYGDFGFDESEKKPIYSSLVQLKYVYVKGKKTPYVEKYSDLTDENDLPYLLYEASNIAVLDHPNIVSLLFKPTGKSLYIPYYNMGALDLMLDNYKCYPNEVFTEMRRLNILYSMADVMRYIEGQGISQADLKSPNIALHCDEDPSDPGVQWKAFLIDFGGMQSHGEIKSIATTPGYAPPELYKEKKLTPKTAVYSFGVLMFELQFREEAYDYGVMSDQEIVKAVCAGTELTSERAKGIDNKRYDALQVACLGEAKKRPSWTDLVKRVEALLAPHLLMNYGAQKYQVIDVQPKMTTPIKDNLKNDTCPPVPSVMTLVCS